MTWPQNGFAPGNCALAGQFQTIASSNNSWSWWKCTQYQFASQCQLVRRDCHFTRWGSAVSIGTLPRTVLGGYDQVSLISLQSSPGFFYSGNTSHLTEDFREDLLFVHLKSKVPSRKWNKFNLDKHKLPILSRLGFISHVVYETFTKIPTYLLKTILEKNGVVTHLL